MTVTSPRSDCDRGLPPGGLHGLRAGSVLGGLGQSLGGSADALLANDLTHDEARAGLPQTTLVIGSAVAALGLSALTARRGRLAALALGCFAAGPGCAAAAAACLGSLALLLAGSMLLGAGNAAVMLCRYAAAGGGMASGPLMAAGGYPELALVGAAVATLAIPLAQTITHGKDHRNALSDLGA